ncbi:hypothetical protein WA577_000368, partial [Blastocystis sp. JDR]
SLKRVLLPFAHSSNSIRCEQHDWNPMSESDPKDKQNTNLMPYCDINEKIIARLVKRNSGISILDVRNFILWLFSLDAVPPTWIFVGNKPQLNNVTLFIANEEDVSIALSLLFTLSRFG